MKSYFYDRTAYKLSDEPVPNCFFLLDEHFDSRFSTIQEGNQHRSVQLAEMVCGRMADVEMYAYLIADGCKRHIGVEQAVGSDADIEMLTRDRGADNNKGAILVRSFLFGYLSACKALLDTGAITLAELYDLPILNVEQRFDNGDFWHQLVVTNPNVHRRYHSLRIFFNEIVKWRDEAANRIPPIALLQANLARRGMQLQLLNEPPERLDQALQDPLMVSWLEPLDLHRRWKPRLLTLCERLCKEIADST